MKYILRSDDGRKFNYLYWIGFNGGFSDSFDDAVVYPTLESAENEREKIFQSQKRWPQLRPLSDFDRRDIWRK